MTDELKLETSPEVRSSVSSFQHQENKSREVTGFPVFPSVVLTLIKLPDAPASQVFIK